MKDCKKCAPCGVLTVLALIGAINWGLVGAFDLDLVVKLCGAGTPVAKGVYILIGIAGFLKLISMFKNFCPCSKSDSCCEKKS